MSTETSPPPDAFRDTAFNADTDAEFIAASPSGMKWTRISVKNEHLQDLFLRFDGGTVAADFNAVAPAADRYAMAFRKEKKRMRNCCETDFF